MAAEYTTNYSIHTPAGCLIPIVVSQFQVSELIPTGDGIAEIIGRLGNWKALGPSGICAKVLKLWLSQDG